MREARRAAQRLGLAEPVNVTLARAHRDSVEARGLDDLAGRLTARYPDHTSGEVSELLACALQATARARVHGYRLLLAERRVRDQLKTIGTWARVEAVA